MSNVERPMTAPAAHLVTVAGPEDSGGLLVGHTLCTGQGVWVPYMPGQTYCLAIDIIQAVVGHQCPNPVAQPDDPSAWVTP